MSDIVPSTSGRPRRSTRASTKVPIASASSSKRKPDGNHSDADTKISRKKQRTEFDPLEVVLRDSRSALTTTDMADVINANTWMMLSQDAQDRLCHLLPPTAFVGYEPTLDPSHPSQVGKTQCEAMDADPNPFRCADTTRLDIFHDSHFVAAANTFQDHIFSGWRSKAQTDLLARFDQCVRDGTVHAPWKDEVWESANTPESNLLAGEAAEQDLRYIIESSLLKVGDILAYKRTFSNVGRRTVEKDALIEFIDPRTSAITIFVQPGIAPLPRALQGRNPPDPTPPTQSMTITSLSQLENGLLDLEGRVGKAERPYENTWKHISLWRWPEGAWEGDFALLRGGRECHGTLFYLRGNLCYDL